jgi:exonuclease III
MTPSFDVVTFNIEKHNRTQITPIFERVFNDGPVDIWGLQEVKVGDGIENMMRDWGYKTAYNTPEFCLAIGPRFTLLRENELVMSEEDYWLERNEALVGVVVDTETGRMLKLLIGHPPAHIADKSHPSWENVYEVHKDYVQRANAIGRNSKMEVITFEDANIDFVRDNPVVGKDWGWWFDGPYKPNRAPSGTHENENGRRIDYLRTTDGLAVAAPGEVYTQKISDHNPYRRKMWFVEV